MASPVVAISTESIVVLAGNANEIFHDLTSYRQVIVITWTNNHLVNPKWMPSVMKSLMWRLLKEYGDHNVDILALSRGMQSFLYCVGNYVFCSDWLKRIGHVILAGGCIWERGNEFHRNSVMIGLQQWATDIDQPSPVNLLVVSRMDSSTCFEGVYFKKGGDIFLELTPSFFLFI